MCASSLSSSTRCRSPFKPRWTPASHVVSDRRLGEPRTNRELFDLLARDGWIPGPLAASLRRMVGFRNVLVHGYDDVDLRVVQDVVLNHLDDLLAFVDAIRGRAK
jgi:uncharacterized protein YutE (UPF0331/DUF86 family)